MTRAGHIPFFLRHHSDSSRKMWKALWGDVRGKNRAQREEPSPESGRMRWEKAPEQLSTLNGSLSTTTFLLTPCTSQDWKAVRGRRCQVLPSQLELTDFCPDLPLFAYLTLTILCQHQIPLSQASRPCNRSPDFFTPSF